MTLEDLSEFISDILGEPQGMFHNIARRRKLMNQAQTTMVRETEALVSEVEIPIEPKITNYYLPGNFLTFGSYIPHFESRNGTITSLDITHERNIDVRNPGWRENTNTSIPKFLWITNQQLHIPGPAVEGTIRLPYVVNPTDLEREQDETFNGVSNLQEFAEGIGYSVAQKMRIGSAPQLAREYQMQYELILRTLRNYIQTNGRRGIFIRPIPYDTRKETYNDTISAWKST